ncbi:CHAD domain-containing protein [Bradyrhizobium sp. NP1]|uniref:CHAD domain-containing protein n=1 Tax=Bradyrhizobium sp. NP1 TaxID=3049772 RepID=UPI0025A5CBCC|nr:CHAD domain-containing protein [Bradyrhizobium sp. NP1]WJR76418.1 CHAD domain-containing protein [Bradyrhizobium sp. NP1]
MACDTAFRIVARRHLDSLNAHSEAAAKGDPNALHQMRVALTHLRSAILFFSPMVEDSLRDEIRDELKWLNGELGAVRDLDVAIERIKAINGKRKPAVAAALQSWKARNAQAHQHLTRMLSSVRYRWLIDQVSAWIENGPWSTKKGKQAAKARALPVADYSADKLAEWESRLLKKSRKLREMGTEKRHRLRLLNKKLTYSIDSLEDLFTSKAFSKQKAALKHLRKAQRSLGELNDAARGDALAGEITQNGAPTSLEFLTPKRKKRLLKKAAKAYRKLDSTI